MTAYVAFLSWANARRSAHKPEMDFYSKAVVKVHLRGGQQVPHEVYGMFHNLIEGERKLVAATSVGDSVFTLTFEVNSPRPATLYLDDDALEIFLLPDSSLAVHAVVADGMANRQSLVFEGATAPVCRYYVARESAFGRAHLRSNRSILASDDLVAYARVLDSLAARETAFLTNFSEESPLPAWFSRFEESEIRYQKAYLKRSLAWNRTTPPGYLDSVANNDTGAVFSYYYYLYLGHVLQPSRAQTDAAETHAQAANRALFGEMRDVYLTRLIYRTAAEGNKKQAQALLDAHQNQFSLRRYVRFLNRCIAPGA